MAVPIWKRIFFYIQGVLSPLTIWKETLGRSESEIRRYICNICGSRNKVLMDRMLRRESVSCWNCKSSLRRRSVVNALSLSLFGNSVPIVDFPLDDRKGLAFSEKKNIEHKLRRKLLGYQNTFYHREPKFDILNFEEDQIGSFDYIVCCEVLEHVIQPIENATKNIYNLLKEGGFALITVPYNSGGPQDGPTVEHFPELYDYELVFADTQNKQRGFQKSQILINTTIHGERQEFSDLAFHGGDGGLNLEMRQFTKESLKELLFQSGFSRVEEIGDDFLHFGIEFLGEYEGQIDKQPIVAWK